MDYFTLETWIGGSYPAAAPERDMGWHGFPIRCQNGFGRRCALPITRSPDFSCCLLLPGWS